MLPRRPGEDVQRCLMFFLSHHPPHEWDRTWTVGSLHVCARCLGTYPTLLFAFIAQLRHHLPLELRGDVLVVLALTLPALLDWAWGRVVTRRRGGRQGNNVLRTGTGVLLGLALGRVLYVHVQRPFPPLLWAQAALVTAVAVPVIIATWRATQGAERPLSKLER